MDRQLSPSASQLATLATHAAGTQTSYGARQRRWHRWADDVGAVGRTPAPTDVTAFIEDELWGTGVSNIDGHLNAVAALTDDPDGFRSHPVIIDARRQALAQPRPPSRGPARALAAGEVQAVLAVPPPPPSPQDALRIAGLTLMRRLRLPASEVVTIGRCDVAAGDGSIRVGTSDFTDPTLPPLLDILDGAFGHHRRRLLVTDTDGEQLPPRRLLDATRKVATNYGLHLDARSGGPTLGIDERDHQRLCQLLDRNSALWLRDQVGLTLLLIGGFRGSGVGRLLRKHVRVTPQGVPVTLPYSKSDQIGRGHVRVLPAVPGLGSADPRIVFGAWLELTRHLAGDAPFWPTRQRGLMHSPPRPYAYGGAAAALSTLLRRRCQAAGIDPSGVSSHSGRHTVRRLLREAGVDLAEAAAYLDHQRIATTLRYGADEPWATATTAAGRIRHQAARR